ncbi:MAG: peptidylprolyl isomerase [Pseudomonadota bacterium]
MTLPGWTREPLIHFLALGALVYLALTWGGTPVDPASRVITVGPEQQAQIALSFERTMGRAPTDAELDAGIEKYVRDEVLYREALRLGLEDDDAVVRQRLISKMDMSAGLGAQAGEPGDAVLRAFFEANLARYAAPAAVSFDQLFFDSQADASAALIAGPQAGQRIDLPASVEDMPMREVQSRFGELFARTLTPLEPGDDWQGPLPSGFGWHLVRLRDRELGEADFDSLRERVLNDWRNAEIAARQQRAFATLREAYRIEIER